MAGGLPVSPGLECTRLSAPGLETWRTRGDDHGASLRSWCRMVAAGMAVVVLLGMSAGHMLRMSPGFATPASHLIRAAAWTRKAVPGSGTAPCVVRPPYPHDEDSLRWGQGGSGQVLGRGFQFADAGEYSSVPAGQGLSVMPEGGCLRVVGWSAGPSAMVLRPPAGPVRHGSSAGYLRCRQPRILAGGYRQGRIPPARRTDT